MAELREAVEFTTLTWVDWFNNRRLLEPIGNIPPAEAEERGCAMLDEQKLAAQLKPNCFRKTETVHPSQPLTPCSGCYLT